MSSQANQPLLKALESITGTGVFCATGAAPFFMPELVVEGVGELAFPLSAPQIRDLIRSAEAAPYGKGLRTVRDDKVRKCWQIDAAKLSFNAPEWKSYLQRTVDAAAAELGVEDKVSSELYKLLIYEKGGHFLPHRDTEKLEAMFGTLIIALPSAHEGGRLLVRHGGVEVAVDFSGRDGLRQFQSAALFADCEHEVEKVTSGVRCCLVYNLVLKKGNPAELNRPLSAHTQQLAPALRGMIWPAPVKPAAVLLEHHYTEANFSLRNLKGNDASRARALLAAADEAGMSAALALVTFHRMGELLDGYDDYYSSRRRFASRYRHDDGGGSSDAKMGEVYEESLEATHWRDAQDRPLPRDVMPLEMDCLISCRPIHEGKPHEQESEGYTGNEGCTVDHWYRRAAVVLWPRAQHEAVLVSTNLYAACQELAALARGNGAAERPELQRLLHAVVDQLPENVPQFSPGQQASDPDEEASDDDDIRQPFIATLAVIARTGQRAALDTLLRTVPPAAFACIRGALWKSLVRTFGAASFAGLSAAWREETTLDLRDPLFLLLNAASVCGESSTAVELARHLAALPPRPAPPSWDAHTDAVPGSEPELRIMLRACAHLTAAKDKAAALKFLKAGGTLPFVRQHLAPALLHWATGKVKPTPGTPAAAALAHSIAVLSEEIVRPILPYPDFARLCPIPELSASWYDRESKPLLAELRAFMASPIAATHIFSRRQAERDTVERWIKNHGLDLDTTTVRKGSPHQLHCTKNTASHQRALTLREDDAKLLRKLQAI